MSANNSTEYDPEEFKDWVLEQMQAVAIPNVAQFAYRMNIAPATIARWFEGARPSTEYVRMFARELKVPILVAYVKAGYFTEEEAGVNIYDRTLDSFATDALIVEIRDRVARLEGQ